MMIPTVHLNGTSKAHLEEQIQGAIDALRAAEDALVYAAPNGRDYYPQGPSAINTAIAEYTARLAAVREVRQQMEAIVEKVVSQ